MQTVFNLFLANLAVADLLFVVLSLFNVIKFSMGSEWVFGNVFCKFYAVVLETSFTGSVCTLAVVAIERYITICKPHIFKRTMKHAVIACVCVWILSILVCAPLWYGSKVSLNSKGKNGCHNTGWTKQVRLIFYIVHTVFLYCLPLVIICFSHVCIAKVLVKRKSQKLTNLNVSFNNEQLQDEVTNSTCNIVDNLNHKEDLKRLRSEQARNEKIIRLLLIIFLTFAVIWTPYIVTRIYIYSGHFIAEIVIRTFQVLILSSTGINFIIYSTVNPAFRKAFKALLCPAKLQRPTKTNPKKYEEDSKDSTAIESVSQSKH